jgi:hypothetical protein
MIRPRVPRLVALCSAALAIALPASAGASFDHHFSVVSRDLRFHEIPGGFIGHTELVDPDNFAARVGKGKIKCLFNERNRKARCRVALHLDGTIGGFGDLLLKGNVGRGESTVLVVNGSGDFAGAVGKAFIHDPEESDNLIDFDLVR